MTVPVRQKIAVASYLIRQKLKGIKRYPLVLMLEPLFKCNLACAGCGKIDYEKDILDQRLTVEESLTAVDECGAPIVSIAGGEPLIHKQMPEIVQGIIAKKKFVYLCTNALLLKKRMKDYQPSPYLTFSIHLDGDQQRHDASVCQDGVFERAVAAIKEAVAKGFRVTINCTLFQGETADEVSAFIDSTMGWGVEGVTVSPGFSYDHAPQQQIFFQRKQSKQLFRDIFKRGKGRNWRLNHSGLYLDFLAGNRNYSCTPWGNPTRNVFGWQKPCYLLVDEGYAKTFKELMEETEWDKYGTGNNPKCANCMAHCGYEPTAVQDTFDRPFMAFMNFLKGPKTQGPMVDEPPPTYISINQTILRRNESVSSSGD